MTRFLRRTVGSALASTVLAIGIVLGEATIGSAHVAVDASNRTAGESTVLTFRAPTESDTANTVSIDVHLPTDTPFTTVRTEPLAGWEAKLVTSDLPAPVTDAHGNTLTKAVTEIIWTATGAGIAPEEFGAFTVQVGPLPTDGTVFFPVVQTYSDGTSVNWVQQVAPGQPEPERPAPSVTVEHAVDTASSSTSAETNAGPSGWWGIALGSVAVVIAAAGVFVGRTRSAQK